VITGFLFQSGVLLITFFVGAAVAGLGVLARAGRVRGGFIWYDVAAMPRHMRNAPFGFIPGGVAICLAAVAGELGVRDHSSATAVALLAMFSLFFTSGWWILRPPEWIKPKWLRTREDSESTAAAMQQLEVPRAAYRVLWVAWAAFVVATFFFERPYLAAGGIGFGLMVLLAMRPRDQRDRSSRSPCGE